MLLQINFKEEKIVDKGKGYIVLKLDYNSQFAVGPYLCSIKGHTKEDSKKNDGYIGKSIFVGTRGGISVE